MAGTKSAATQMFDRSSVVKRGPNPMSGRLELTTQLGSGETVYPGHVCSLNSDGQLIRGLSAGSGVNRPMPLFSTGDTELDTDVDGQQGNFAGGYIGAVVATGGFEIQTTQYVSSASYAINDLLTVATGDDKGLVTKASAIYSTQAIVGCVSKKVQANEFSKNVLTFWTMFLPASA